jgi:nucleoside-diphosphate-sugar epimerase
MPLTCAITGANGYVGGVIADAFRVHGWNVVELGRKPTARAAGMFRPFSLNEPLDAQALSGIKVLVHCAYDFSPIDKGGIQRSNVDGTLALFRSASAAGVGRIIFISSMSAFEGCKSLYGQAKLSVEKKAAEFGLIIVRPGLVYGPDAKGMVGSLQKLAALPLLTPMVGLGQMVLYLAHEKNLGELIVRLADPATAAPTAPVIAANDQPMTFREIVRILGVSQGRGKKLIVPIPSAAIWAMLKVAESAGLRPRLRSDSLVSLMNQEPRPDFAPLKLVGVPFPRFGATAIA